MPSWANQSQIDQLLRDYPAEYRTPAGPITHERDVERSRFLCTLTPVADEVAARACIEQARTDHPRARHHCSAFVLGARGHVRRSSDDQEPSGTAGAPMLQALAGAGLTDVVAVVTRYFGGRLLGAGRLTRTYRETVAETVAQAPIALMRLHALLRFSCELGATGPIEGLTARHGWTVTNRDWGTKATYTVAVPAGEAASAAAELAALTSGTAVAALAGHQYLRIRV